MSREQRKVRPAYPNAPAGTCHGCGKPTGDHTRWHRTCRERHFEKVSYAKAAAQREGDYQRCVVCHLTDGQWTVDRHGRRVQVKVSRDHVVRLAGFGRHDWTAGRCQVCHADKSKADNALSSRVRSERRARRGGGPTSRRSGMNDRHTTPTRPRPHRGQRRSDLWWRVPVAGLLLAAAGAYYARETIGGWWADHRGQVYGWTAATAVVLLLVAVGRWRHRRVRRHRDDALYRLGFLIAKETRTDPTEIKVKARRWSHQVPVAGQCWYSEVFDDDDPVERERIEAKVSHKLGVRLDFTWSPARDTFRWAPSATDGPLAADQPDDPDDGADRVARVTERVEDKVRSQIKGTVTFTWAPADAVGPTGVKVEYPSSYDDEKDDTRQMLVDAVNSKAPGRWRARWDTEQNVVEFERRPPMRSDIPIPVGTDADRWRLPFGVDEHGDTVAWDMRHHPHCLVSGGTGSGKTVLLRSIVQAAVARGFVVVAVDPKRIEMAGLRGWPGVRAVATTTEEMIALVDLLATEMDNRYAAIEAGDVDEDHLAPVLVVIDEAREWLDRCNAWWKGNKRAGMTGTEHPVVERWRSMARLGRSSRVHLLVGIQRPDAKVFGGEALAVDTPIPTPVGWTTMGEIKPDDYVFGADGRPVRVAATTEVAYDRPCYRVTFSDGTSVVTDAEHLWEASDVRVRQARTRRERRRAAGLRVHRERSHPAVVTTEHIALTQRDRDQSNWSVRLGDPLALPTADLPVDPWLLGYWLGDGYKDEPRIATADGEVLDRIRALGYNVVHHAAYNYGISTGPKGWANGRPTLKGALREIGVLGDKHVPDVYLRASVGQRAALLAGLLDSDGSCSVRGSGSGQVAFTNVDRRLIDAVLELARSLGFAPTVHTTCEAGVEAGESSVAYGRPRRRAWRVTFTPDRQVFGIERKREMLAPALDHPRRCTLRQRYITGVERVESVPVRCISVDTPDHLYLCGLGMVPTHNCRDNYGFRVALGPMSEQGAKMMFGRADVGRDIPTDAKGRATVGIGEDRSLEVQGYNTPDPRKRLTGEPRRLVEALRALAAEHATDALPKITEQAVTDRAEEMLETYGVGRGRRRRYSTSRSSLTAAPPREPSEWEPVYPGELSDGERIRVEVAGVLAEVTVTGLVEAADDDEVIEVDWEHPDGRVGVEAVGVTETVDRYTASVTR